MSPAAGVAVERNLDATLQHTHLNGPQATVGPPTPILCMEEGARISSPAPGSSIALSPICLMAQQHQHQQDGFASLGRSRSLAEEVEDEFDEGYEPEDEVGGHISSWKGSEREAAELRRIRVTAEAEVHNLPSTGVEEEEQKQQQPLRAAPAALEAQWGQEQEEEGEVEEDGGVAREEGGEQEEEEEEEEEERELLPAELARMRLLMHATARSHSLPSVPSPHRPWNQGVWSAGGAAASASSPGGLRDSSSPGGLARLEQQQQGWEEGIAVGTKAACGIVTIVKYGAGGTRPLDSLAPRPRLRYKGTLLPNRICVQDEEGMRRIAAKVRGGLSEGSREP
jgi:hypothetical protein